MPIRPLPFDVSSRVMRLQPAAVGVVLLASLGLASTFIGHPSVTLAAIVVLCACLAAYRPDDGLLLLAGLGPVGTAAAVAVGSPDWCMPMAMAVLAGAAIGRIARRETSADSAVADVATLWAILILTSLAVVIDVARRLAPSTAAFDAPLIRWFTHTFPHAQPFSFPGFWSALLALCGVGLFALTADRCARSPGLGARLTTLLTISMSGVGVLSLYRVVEISLRRPPLLQSVASVWRSVRVSIVIGDVNAAGGLFLMMLPAAVCAVFTPTRRLFGAMMLPGLVAGLWLSGSRTALVLLPVAAVAAVALSWPQRGGGATKRALRRAALVAAFALVAASLWFSRVGSSPGTTMSFGVRREMGYVTAGMVRRYPVFGVGIGEFHSRSTEWMSPLLRGWYRAENAHNQFFQVLGELGLSGLAVFLALLWLGLWPALRAIGRTRTPSLAGSLVGVLAFVGTWLSGHQLLTAQAAIAFWILLGVTRTEGLRTVASPPEASRRRPLRTVLLLGAGLALAATVPMRTQTVIAGMQLEGTATGMSVWQTDPATGRRFRSASGPATIYIDSRAPLVHIPLRSSARGELRVEVLVNGVALGTVALPPGEWIDYPLTINPDARARGPQVAFQIVWSPREEGDRVDVGREDYAGGRR